MPEVTLTGHIIVPPSELDAVMAEYQAILDRSRRWLAEAGIRVVYRSIKGTEYPIEISPKLAIEARQLRERLSSELVISQPSFLT